MNFSPKIDSQRSESNPKNNQGTLKVAPFFPTAAKRSFFRPVHIYPKLKVNTPNNRYEREADAVADAVMRMPDSQLQMQPVEEEEEETLQMKPEQNDLLQMKQQAPEIARQINFSKGSGSSMAPEVQQEMAHKMGTDFGSVNIHTDSKAVQMNRQLGAKAFTHGSDIYFNKGEYNPNSQTGKRLLAHELTHVVQQTGFTTLSANRLQRKEPSEEQKEWLPELDQILPKGVGLLHHIFRVSTLIDIFGTEPLKEHVLLIHSDAAAKQFTIKQGVRGIVALHDTRSGRELNVDEAKQALNNNPGRYRRDTIENLRFVPSQNKLLSKTQRIALSKRLKEKQKKIQKLKDKLKTDYDLEAIVDGDKDWTIEDLQEVIEAFKVIPASDKKALENVTLKRVISLGGKTAGKFTLKQSVSDTTVTNKAVLELANGAFEGSMTENRLVIIHEVGHAVAKLAQRTAVHAEHLAIAELNRRIEASEPALEAFNEAVDELNNEVLQTYNNAVDEFNAARRSGDQERIAEAKKNFEAARAKYKKKKLEVARLRTAWKQEEKKVKAGEEMVAEKQRKTQKVEISDADLRRIKNRAAQDKSNHKARLRVADRKFAREKENTKAESRTYVSAIREVSKALKAFAEKTADQSVLGNDVQTQVENIDEKIKVRDSEREKLNETNENNAALTIYTNLEQAQEAWFASASAHALANRRSARVQQFVEFVGKKDITPRTIYPSNSYAEENWPHKPEEFYAEVYSMFVVKPDELKARSKALYDWFKANKYL